MAYAPVQETLAPVVGGTPDEVERYRRLAEALMAQAGSGEPVEHWMEGVGRLAQALSGGLVERKAAKLEREGEAGARQAILDNLDLFAGGGDAGGTSGGEYADVPGTEPIAATGDDADMIIRTVIGEAAGEPPEGQQAVASVIMNRAKQSGMTPSQVVLAKGQFEPWGSRGRQLRAIDPNSEQYRRVAAAVMPVLQGRARDPTGGATHFYAPKAQAALGRSTPSWAQGQGLDIGNHRFYSLGYGGGGRHGIPGETADIPGAEPIGFAPSPDVMAHIAGRQPTPAGISIQETPTITGAPPPGGAGTVPMPPVAAPPVHPLARVPQSRPVPPAVAAPAAAPATAAPATTGSVAAPVAPRPVTMPPVKNDYAQFPGRQPSVAPVRPGQFMNEPYPGVMSAQEFARQGQAAMRARAAGQQPAAAPVAGTASQPRRNLLQALLGRGGPQGPASPPAAPVAPAAPAGGAVAPVDDRRARIASFLANPRVPDAYKLAALKRLSPQERDPFTLSPGQVRYGPDGRPIAEVPAAPEKGTDDQREYQQAVEQGYTGSFVDYMREMKKAGATIISTGTPEAGDAALRKKLGDQEGERWSTLKEAGLTAGAMVQNMDVLDQLIEIAPQGPLTGRLAQAFPGFSSAGDLFQSIVNEAAPKLRVEGSGATSDIEFAGMLKAMPSLQNRPEANRAIAGVFKAKAALNIERSDVITAYESGEIDASTARTRLAAVDRKSIMTPEMDQLLKGVSGTEAAPEAGPARPTSKTEYDALPSGAPYIHPDDPEGSPPRRKP